jgi:hypothetical protein
MLWYLDGDSSMELNGQKLQPVIDGYQTFAIEYSTVEDLDNIADLFWERKLGLSESCWDTLMYYFGEFMEEAKQLKPCEYYNGNYSIICIDKTNIYKIK